MMNTIVCPGCGRSVSVDPDPAGRVLCPGCGKSLTRFARAQSPLPADENIEPTASAVTTPPPISTRQPRVRQARDRHTNQLILIGVTLLAGICLLSGAVFVGYSLRGTSGISPSSPTADLSWEQEHRSEFFTLKADAESRVLDGDLKGGHAKYRELQLLVGSHPIHDPALFDLIQDAKTSQERVYNMLLTKQETALGYYNSGNENASGPSTASSQPVATPAPQTVQSPIPQTPYPAASPPPALPETTSTQPATLPSIAATPAPNGTPQPAAAPAPARTPALPPAAVFAGHEADRQIGLALDRGIAFLISKFANGQIVDGLPADAVQHQGLDALCVYALLHASESSSDPTLSIHGQFMTDAIRVLKSFRMETDANRPMTPVVYARSLRAAALSVYDRADDRPMLRGDVAWLIKAATDGAYTYDDRFSNPPATSLGPGASAPAQPRQDIPQHPDPGTNAAAPITVAMVDLPAGTQLADNGERPGPIGPIFRPPPLPPTQPPPQYNPLRSDTPPGPGYPQNAGPPPWDNSNSQYGLLGVWSGAEAGVEVPTAYWKAVEKHWLSCELANGQWFYANGAQNGTLSMTCAGIASLLVTHEWLDAPALGTRVGRPPYSPALAQGLKWLETGDHVTDIFTPDLHYLGYTIYGIERCALASGFKFFGNHDWFTEISQQILPYQAPNGSWGRTNDGPDALIDTAYTVLFLTRGRHPVMMNKLRVEPYWDNRPRDLANLTRFASRELERPLNWQVVSFERPWSDWMDAPILYIASHQAMKLSEDDIGKLRGYAEAGGLIFTHADSAATEFNNFAAELAKKLWPQYPMQEMPANHELFSVNYHLTNPPKLKMVTNGSRILMVHSPTDLSPAWQERMTRGREKETFQFGVNLFIWAAGRTNFRNRLDSPYIAEPTGFPSSTVNVARIKYDGNWDPEPYAWTRFSRYLQWNTNIAVKPMTVELKDLKPGEVPVAVITGNAVGTFTDADVIAARAFVEAGGTLLIDNCGGGDAFAQSAETLLITRAFPNITLTPIPPTDPLIAGGQPNLDNLTKPVLRGYATEKLGNAEPPAVQMLGFGKGKVIFTRLDLTTGLLGTNSWGINGYTPGYCEALVKNLLLRASR